MPRARTSAEVEKEKPKSLFLNEEEALSRLRERTRKRLYFVVLVDESEDLAITLHNRIASNLDRKVLLINFETFMALSHMNLNLPQSTTLYLTAHGYIKSIGGRSAETLGEAVFPFLRNNLNVSKVKLASCHSGEKLVLTDPSIPPEIREKLEGEHLHHSYAQRLSSFLHTKNCDREIYGYVGLHGERRKNREKHSFVEIGTKEYRASEGRVCFFKGAQTETASKKIKQFNTLEYSAQDASEDVVFKLGF